MNRAFVPLFILITLIVGVVFGADAPSFAGEYADKQFHGGKAVFHMSIEGTGNNTQVWFSAGNNDGQGTAPEGQGKGKFTGKGTLEFKFTDSCNNSGTGTITKNGDDIVVSMKPNRVADSGCTAFYEQNMRLKHAKKG